MKKEDIHLSDWQRILMGDIPAEFYIELIIRTLFVYLVITFGMKYMGKRISAELNRSELAAIATLAAATGLVLLTPERGLLPPIIILIVILGIKSALDWFNYKYSKAEGLAEGKLSVLVEEGILQMKQMKSTRISREQLFAQLRSEQIIHLGTVKRMYLEANGAFSVLRENEPKPGLAVIPEWDQDFINEYKKDQEQFVCTKCGRLEKQNHGRCRTCGNNGWTRPITE